MAVVVFEVHAQQELRKHQTKVSPHRVAEVELVIIHFASSAEHPQTERHEDSGCENEVNDENVAQREREATALDLVLGDYSDTTDYRIGVQDDCKDTT